MSKNNETFFDKKNDWSDIKDRLLCAYLEPYFQKVLTTKRPIFYVDCFAGKGRFGDGKDGSPRMALTTRKNCMARTTETSGEIELCFIELNYASDLKENTSEFKNATIVEGRYEEKIEEILKKHKSKNIFLYVDPYGIKALDCALFDKFSRSGFNSVELLINLNSFGFIRDACRVMKATFDMEDSLNDLVEFEPTQVDTSQESFQLLNSVAGGDYWQEIIKDYCDKKFDCYEAEKRFSHEYKKRLQKNYTYVLDMPIRLKAGQHPKYRMVHACNHEDGCILMADNMFSRVNELFTEIQQRGQIDLFQSGTENAYVDERGIHEKMKSFISTARQTADKLIAEFFTEYGVICKSGDIRKVWKEMERKGEIIVVRDPPQTERGTPSTFFTEDKKHTVTIVRGKL